MTVSGTPGPDWSGRVHRTAMWAGHRDNKIFVALAVLFILGDLSGHPDSGPLYWASLPVLLAWGFALWSSMAGPHRRQLCERCASAAPLDPQAQVRRWNAALRLNHARRFMISILAVILVKALILDHLFKTGAWSYSMDATALFAICVTSMAQDVHRRLQPWCPYCRWDGGGRTEVSPEVPDPSVSR